MGRSTIHGYSGHYLYPTWKEMVQRCHNPTDKDYSRYGGSGIYVCVRWKKVENFIPDILSSIGHRPTKYTLDRIDGTKGYEPGNVKWSSYSEQNRNKPNALVITIDGVTKHLYEWASEYSIKPDTLKKRLKRQGLSGKALLVAQRIRKEKS